MGRKSNQKDRPKKPYPEYPLYPHPLGYWSKKVNGTIRHFGRWARVVDGELTPLPYEESWSNALKVYKAQIDDIQAGRVDDSPVVRLAEATSDALTVADLCNKFLASKLRKLEAGEIGRRMWAEYKATTDQLIIQFGKTRRVDSLVAEDFATLRAAIAERAGPIRLGNEITRTKSVFKFAWENGLISQPIRYGSEFAKPGKAVLRRHRAQNGQRMMEADECRRLIEAASTQLKAMILLGLNCGYGNHDCATLPLAALDLDKGWIDFPRPKTGIARRCPLWAETVQALRDVISERPTPRDDADNELVFLNSRGRRWLRDTKNSRTDSISVHFANLLDDVDLHREGVGFYTLRHVHRTIADGARDPIACDLIMGHADPTMGGHYRERIDDARLMAVAEHVRDWLWPTPTEETPDHEPKLHRQRPHKIVKSTKDVRSLRLFAG